MPAPSSPRLIVPDYEPPSAMMVALFTFNTMDTLEQLATELGQRIGVILIGPDGYALQTFAKRHTYPDHFAVVTADYDSPWIRDHAPIATRSADGIHQILPRAPLHQRPKDASLFDRLLAAPAERTDIYLPAGNVVRGPDGIAISTTSLLEDNTMTSVSQLDDVGRQLGIQHWLITDPFPDDITQHTDCMIRFLNPDLCAVVRRQDCEISANIIAKLAKQLQWLRPNLRVLDIPTTATQSGFDSPVNWVQVGRDVLLPQFGDDDPNCARTADILQAEGFFPVLIPAETQGLGGGLHCLTGTIYS